MRTQSLKRDLFNSLFSEEWQWTFKTRAGYWSSGKTRWSWKRYCEHLTLLISTSKSFPQAGAQKEYNPGNGSGQTLPLWTGAKMQRYINRLSHTQKAGKWQHDSSKGRGGWEERVTGAATLTKDYGRKSYFIQIFDMQYCQQVRIPISFVSPIGIKILNKDKYSIEFRKWKC